MDKTMGKELQKALRKMEMEFFFKHKVKAIEYQGEGLTITAENEKGETVTFNGDYCLVSVGRRPYTEGLALENAGLRTDDKGRVVVDEHFRTALPHIYAIGDVIQGVMLAHKAEEEGVVTAEIIAGQKPHINYLLIPNVVYTWPEVASVGYTEEELKAKNIPYNTGTFPFKASGRARASMDTDGLVKVLSHKETDEILGVHMIGPRTADMIAEAVVAMEFRASAEDIGMMSHAHPTFTEAFKEACLVATGKGALNM
jgi:dihydrolipoamide dehydrogenase